jgi:hypothetical protein
MALLPMFLLLFSTGLGITGISGYLIFGPLTYRQSCDHGLRVGSHAFAPSFLRWILGGGFRATRDRSITGLATPAQILAWCALIGGVLSAVVLLPYAW